VPMAIIKPPCTFILANHNPDKPEAKGGLF